MVRRHGAVPKKGVDIGVGPGRRSGKKLAAAKGVHRRLRQDFAREPYGLPHLGPVPGGCHEIQRDDGRILRPRGAENYPSPAQASLRTDLHLESVCSPKIAASLVGRNGEEIELQVGKPHAWFAADKGATLEMVARQQTVTAQQPAGCRRRTSSDTQTARK